MKDPVVPRTKRANDETFDPFAPIHASPRFATGYAVIAGLLGVVSVVGLAAPFAGPLGMGFGLVSHVKGSRYGMPAAVFAGIAMIVGMSIAMYLK
jgi:hypothetical protein